MLVGLLLMLAVDGALAATTTAPPPPAAAGCISPPTRGAFVNITNRTILVSSVFCGEWGDLRAVLSGNTAVSPSASEPWQVLIDPWNRTDDPFCVGEHANFDFCMAEIRGGSPPFSAARAQWVTPRIDISTPYVTVRSTDAREPIRMSPVVSTEKVSVTPAVCQMIQVTKPGVTLRDFWIDISDCATQYEQPFAFDLAGGRVISFRADDVSGGGVQNVTIIGANLAGATWTWPARIGDATVRTPTLVETHGVYIGPGLKATVNATGFLLRNVHFHKLAYTMSIVAAVTDVDNPIVFDAEESVCLSRDDLGGRCPLLVDQAPMDGPVLWCRAAHMHPETWPVLNLTSTLTKGNGAYLPPEFHTNSDNLSTFPTSVIVLGGMLLFAAVLVLADNAIDKRAKLHKG